MVMPQSSAAAVQRARMISGDDRGGSPLPTTDLPAMVSYVPSSVQQLFRLAGTSPIQFRNMSIRLVTELILSFALLCFAGFRFIGVLLLIGTLALEFISLKRQASKRVLNFERDYSALLIALSSSVKAGINTLDALGNASSLFPEKSEMRIELERFQDSIKRGATIQDALSKFASTIAYPDVRMFIIAIILNYHEGASVADCLQRLTKVTRQRQSFRRKIKAALAMQKLSAVGIALSFIGIGLMQFLANSKGLLLAFHHPVGSKLIMVGTGLMLFGLGWMSRMLRRTF